jgi:outer membrane protein assembly factor BamB
LNILRKLAHNRVLALALIALLLAGACVPVRLESKWPSVSVIGPEKNLMVAFHDRLVMIDVLDGTPVKLRNADGEVRLDDEGKARVWEFMVPEAGQPTNFYSAPALTDDNQLLVATNHNKLFRIDLPTGRTATTTGVDLPGGVLVDPVLTGDKLVLGLAEADLVALEGADFTTEAWRIDTQRGVWADPLLVDDTLYFGSLDHHLRAVNVETGAELWQLDLGGAVMGQPVYNDGHLYVGSLARKVFDISADGQILSQFDTVDWVWGSPTLVDGVLYTADLSGTVYALEVGADGFREVWRAKPAADSIVGRPVVWNEYVIVGARDRNVYWLNREDGSTFFARPVADEVLTDPVLIEPDESVDIPEAYVIFSTITNGELLVAFTAQNGERVWSYGR